LRIPIINVRGPSVRLRVRRRQSKRGRGAKAIVFLE
jgi:hypothetical protein